jgi:2-oxoacid:acceptor oxidoreductase delta subunit (pyruvate/2-ketoisovalerate family)
MCGICIEFCPEGNMIEYQERLCIDYEICKGCGVCATECPHKAIDMVREED